MPNPPSPPSERATLRRQADLAAYDRPTVDSILDAGLVAHVGLVDADGTPVVIPMAYARLGDRVVVHGSVASRLMRGGSGAAVCLTVTILDGLIVARSLFESSMRYRSVVVRGVAVAVERADDRREALLALSERLIPGRSLEARLPNEKELAATRVWAVELDECSAKVSVGFPEDPADDVALDVWAGVVPLLRRWGDPVAAPDLRRGIPVDPSVSALAADPRLVGPELG